MLPSPKPLRGEVAIQFAIFLLSAVGAALSVLAAHNMLVGLGWLFG